MSGMKASADAEVESRRQYFRARKKELRSQVEMHEKALFYQSQVAVTLRDELLEIENQIEKAVESREGALAQARTADKAELAKALYLALEMLRQLEEELAQLKPSLVHTRGGAKRTIGVGWLSSAPSASAGAARRLGALRLRSLRGSPCLSPRRGRPRVEGLVGTFLRASRRDLDVHAHVPPTAASDTARLCRLDGHTVALRGYVPVKTRCEKLEALELSRYMRVTLLVNLRRLARRTDKLDQMSRELCLPAATHLGMTSGEHLFDLEPALSLLLKLTSSHPCSAAGFGCFGCMWWLQELGGWQRRGQLFGMLAMVDVLAATVAVAAWFPSTRLSGDSAS